MAKELKFLRGSYTNWSGLKTKDADSFYIVEHRNESDAFVKYDLYLGDKFLCDGVSKEDLANAVTNLVGGATGDYNTLGGLQTKVQALEAAVGTGSTVADKITAAIEALDVTNNVSDANYGVTVEVNETDGKVDKPVVAITPATYTSNASGAGSLEEKKLVDSKALSDVLADLWETFSAGVESTEPTEPQG